MKFHPEVLDDLPALLETMTIKSESDNRIRLESPTHAATVRLDWDGEKQRWLLTAYKKETPPAAVDERAAGSARDGSPALGAGYDIALERAGIKIEGLGPGVTVTGLR